MKKISLLTASVALALVGCGGDNSDEISSSDYTFRVLDGYLSQVNITADVDLDGVCESEVIGTTDSAGIAKLAIEYKTANLCVVTTGDSIDAQRGPVADIVTLQAPAGSETANPFTDFKMRLIADGKTNEAADSLIADAMADLGLELSAIYGDYIASSEGAPSDLALKKVTLIGETLFDNPSISELANPIDTLEGITTTVAAFDETELNENYIAIGSDGTVTEPSRPTLVATVTEQTVQQHSAMVPVSLTATGTNLTYQHSGIPAGISFNSATATFSGTPTTTGVFTINTVVIDANKGRSKVVTLTLTVEGNKAPEVVNPAPENIVLEYGDASTSISVVDWFSDPESDDLTYYLDPNSPLPKGLVLNEQSGIISGTVEQAGSFEIHLYAKDRDSYSSKVTVTITIDNALPPVLNPTIPAQTVKQGVEITPIDLTTIFGPDPDGGENRYQLSDAPARITVENASIVGSSMQIGTHHIKVVAIDDENQSTASVSFTLTIEKDESLPEPGVGFANYEGMPLYWMQWNKSGFKYDALNRKLENGNIEDLNNGVIGSYQMNADGTLVFAMDAKEDQLLDIAYESADVQLLVHTGTGNSKNVWLQSTDQAKAEILLSNLNNDRPNEARFIPGNEYVSVYDDKSDNFTAGTFWQCDRVTFTTGNQFIMEECGSNEPFTADYSFNDQTGKYVISIEEDGEYEQIEFTVTGGQDDMLIVNETGDYSAKYFFKEQEKGMAFFDKVKQQPLNDSEVKTLLEFMNQMDAFDSYLQSGIARWKKPEERNGVKYDIYVVGNESELAANMVKVTDGIAILEGTLGDFFNEPKFVTFDTKKYEDPAKPNQPNGNITTAQFTQDLQDAGITTSGFVISFDTAVVINNDYAGYCANATTRPYEGDTRLSIDPETQFIKDTGLSWINLGNGNTEGKCNWDAETVSHEFSHSLGFAKHSNDSDSPFASNDYFSKWSPQSERLLKSLYINEPKTEYSNMTLSPSVE
ncbi:putative Ig domain-containing protein [Vibrio sp. 404]|uniref:Putative Ig domain-containing protein n=1 Tax=Vibrio marinisediminis TaxID=2758441 RepID=A0A7W2FN08_9VIBR|nr:Ig domain-containing protein [Vibrio marinisediminis]MBA5761043.1 putative Ig domain-containing protein [Vibrio marinisediminis]